MFFPMSWTSPFTVARRIFPRGLHRPGRLLGLEVRRQDRDRLLHDAGALDDLREEHLPRAEEVADDVHPGHERPLDDGERRAELLERLERVGLDVVGDPLHEGVGEPLLDGARRARPRRAAAARRPASLAFSPSAKATSRSVASGRRFRRTSSTSSRSSFGISS